MALKAGHVIDEFEIVDYLGSGAAGDVYLVLAKADNGQDIVRGRKYALKVYKEWILGEPNQTERMMREMKSSQRARHPNIVRIYDARVNHGSPPKSYLVMEFIDGVTLDIFVEKNKPLSLDVVEVIFRQLIGAIDCLHDEYIFHRDIKPQNIMVDSSNKITLMDLGVAKFELETTITPSKEFLGTIRYSAPEMLYGEKYGKEVDLYSAGAVLYLLLTGKEPFENEKVFSNLIVSKKDNPQLRIKDESGGQSFRHKILSQLVPDLTAEMGDDRYPRLSSAYAVKQILRDPNIELSDWWICSRILGDFGLERLSDFKSMVIRYLDPRMPKNRVERLKTIAGETHDAPVLASYLSYIETETGRREIKEFLRELYAKWDEGQEEYSD